MDLGKGYRKYILLKCIAFTGVKQAGFGQGTEKVTTSTSMKIALSRP